MQGLLLIAFLLFVTTPARKCQSVSNVGLNFQHEVISSVGELISAENVQFAEKVQIWRPKNYFLLKFSEHLGRK